MDIQQTDINDILANSEFRFGTVFDKCAVLHCRLPNGFVITAESAASSVEKYDPRIGQAICEKKIADQLTELESYRIHCQENENKEGSDAPV